MKKKIIALLVVLSAVSITIGYYTVRLPATSVFPHVTQVEKIYFTHFVEDELAFSLIEFNDNNTELHQMMNILESVSYTRSIGRKNIRNGGKTFMMMVFYRDSDGILRDYDLDINEKGFVVSDKKKYKMADREKEVFDRLSAWLIEKGVDQPIVRQKND